MKITFMGAGSTVFARNVIGDCMCSEALRDSTFALYDIDGQRLEESRVILEAMRQTKGGYGKIECYLGVENRKEALRGANFVVNAIQVGLYDPCTIIDFEIPKKYGLRQTIGDTLGIAASCAHFAPFPFFAALRKIWKRFVRTHGCSTIQTPWRCSQAICSATQMLRPSVFAIAYRFAPKPFCANAAFR